MTFVLQTDEVLRGATNDALVLDLAEQRVVRWMANAGLVPELQFEAAG